MNSEIAAILRRNDPTRWTKPLRKREPGVLFQDPDRIKPGARIMLDTTVYIDELKSDLPEPIGRLLDRCVVLHTSTARAEIAYSIGALDPKDPRSPARRSVLETLLDRMPAARCVSASDRTWLEAAVLTGILRRVQSLDDVQRRALMNDALIVLTAREAGAIAISRNTRDMDWLTALRPDAKVLLYAR